MEKYILAIEIGSSKIKGAVGIIDDDGILSVTAIEEEKLVDSVRHGLILNVETVSKHLNAIIRKLENRVSPRKARSVYVGIGGRSFVASPRELERQFPDEMEISSELVDQLRNEALATAMSDREVVAVTDGEYFVDQRQAQNPIGIFGRNLRASFNLITCRPQVKRNIARAVTERAKLKTADYIVRQLAQAELVLTGDERRQGCMLVDLGAETTTVSIYKFGVLRYMATIPLGSRCITRDLTTLGYTEERAEEIKKAGANAMPTGGLGRQSVDGIDYTEINAYVQARATEIVVNINEQITYANLSYTDLTAGIVMVGGGAKLKGFYELLENITKLKVRSGITSPTIRISSPSIPTYESIDVISILAAAAKLDNVVDCMSPLAPATPVVPAVEAEPAAPVPEVVEEPEVDRREVYDDYERRERNKQRSVFISGNEDDPIEDEIKRPSGPGRFRSLINRFQQRMVNILDENEDDDDEYTGRGKK